MKKILYSLIVLCVSSCTTYRQVCNIQSNLDDSTEAYIHSNDECDVVYDFWSEGGIVRFLIENKTDSIIFIDLTKSYFVRNGFSYDYYLNRITELSRTNSTTIGTAVSGSVYGYWSNIKDYKGNNMPGGISATKVNSSTATSSSSVSYIEKPIISVYPHTSKVFAEYHVMEKRYKDNSLGELPIGSNVYEKKFESHTSPVMFQNAICYRVGQGDDKYIINYFYVDKIMNTKRSNSIKSSKSFYFDYVNY